MKFSRRRRDTEGGAGLLDNENKRVLGKTIAVVLLVYLVVCLLLGWYWSREPDLEDLNVVPVGNMDSLTTGSYTARTVREVARTLLDKPGGFISNDITPPGLWLDNMPSWEFGVLVQVRDITRSMRRDMARSQSQSTEDAALSKAEPLFHFDHKSWALPASENEYRAGIRQLDDYIERLESGNASFYTRADNLAGWINDVSTRLGSLSQRLSASVARTPLNEGGRERKQTPWLQIDNVFYEARGSAWALVHLLRAVEKDYADVLNNKNALVSLRQIIRELEATQAPMWSPMILNGGGFGVLANHSLVMANYLSRANAALIDLRRLLEQG
ncbi:DUF2333 domain-containing protein [Pseudomonas sp. G11-1]|uniref:DUF2333 family protein n=1 Tax=Halopseudomonas bauzanensis TaxID=653930 RepID=A0A031MHD7_9GAMM|nr:MULTISPECIES: DUF2333 family protein [Halopseudomonas]MCO5785066.1 DUF2333 domain-containing protein [Pseudomonas sp. G11-1]MCO5788831.1 DUF2333 domain-containing protein [Pseudomonas sp. G11-2]EZQ19169.1 hypothetical protein CF98_01470 [Halopseudomonas bauzanensis]TKA90750.1 DUF2333 family protein [Halopseudomonas bauzanensis]WGK60683.1 DUF2333 family protein [Halopseudomonas sp. SMJS2]